MEKLATDSLINQQQLDMNLMAESELSRLKRQYRIMEGDRKAFYEETMTKLIKQRKLIEVMQNEKKNLITEIKIATTRNQKKKDFEVATRLVNLLHIFDKSSELIRKEKLRLKEIDKQIKKTEQQIIKVKSNQITDNTYKEKLSAANKSVVILENRLETTTKRFCSIVAENKASREKIDHLLKQRTNFNTSWEKLLQDLNSGKKFLLDLVEQAIVAFDQREEWCSKLQTLKVRTHNDQIIHSQDMREMQRELDHDGKLKEFFTIKGQKRIMKDLEEKEMRKRELSKEKAEKQIQVYQETLEKIKEFCRQTSIEKIATKFIKQDEENFALFNYVNELSHELESLTETINNLKCQIDEYKTLSEERAKKQQENLNTFNLALQKATHEADDEEKILNKSKETFLQILNAISEIFHLLNCDCAPILDLLGNNNSINNDNVLIYMGLIEKRLATLTTNTYFKEKMMNKQYKKYTRRINKIK